MAIFAKCPLFTLQENCSYLTFTVTFTAVLSANLTLLWSPAHLPSFCLSYALTTHTPPWMLPNLISIKLCFVLFRVVPIRPSQQLFFCTSLFSSIAAPGSISPTLDYFCLHWTSIVNYMTLNCSWNNADSWNKPTQQTLTGCIPSGLDLLLYFNGIYVRHPVCRNEFIEHMDITKIRSVRESC